VWCSGLCCGRNVALSWVEPAKEPERGQQRPKESRERTAAAQRAEREKGELTECQPKPARSVCAEQRSCAHASFFYCSFYNLHPITQICSYNHLRRLFLHLYTTPMDIDSTFGSDDDCDLFFCPFWHLTFGLSAAFCWKIVAPIIRFHLFAVVSSTIVSYQQQNNNINKRHENVFLKRFPSSIQRCELFTGKLDIVNNRHTFRFGNHPFRFFRLCAIIRMVNHHRPYLNQPTFF
jgi:hypothetical protein